MVYKVLGDEGIVKEEEGEKVERLEKEDERVLQGAKVDYLLDQPSSQDTTFRRPRPGWLAKVQ